MMGNRTALLTGVVVLSGLLLPLAAGAQESEAQEGKKPKKANPKAVVERYQADLKPVESLGFETIPKADVTWQKRANGDVSLEVMVRDLVVPERTEIDRVEVDLVLDGRAITTFWIRDMRGRVKLDSTKGDRIPPVTSGQTVELRRRGRAIMRGQFRER